jgi:glucose-1-phosphate adenylyltransferase
LFKGVKVGKGARIKSAVILPDTIVEENVWIENAVIGSQSLIKQGVIIIPRNPAEHLMVVGNRETVDIMIEEDNLPVNNLKTVISY